jgi:hypothetical protein
VSDGTAAREVPADPGEAVAAVGRAAEDWGAEWEPRGLGGTLVLPVLHGLRRGWVRGEVTVSAAGGGARVAFLPGEHHEHLHTTAVGILVLAAAGAVLTVLWPFVPALLPVAPFGALLALGGWFLVVSRLRTSGPEDFLALVAHHAGRNAEPAAPVVDGADL